MIINIKKVTREDRFAREYYCNAYRFTSKMKKRNRRRLRRYKEIDLIKTP